MATKPMTFQDILNLQQQSMMGEMSPEQSMSLTPPAQPEPQAPMIPNETPQEQVFTKPQLSDILPEKPQAPEMADQQQPQVPMLAEAEKPALSKTEQLLQEYRDMIGKDRQSLEEARKRDRMLKIGGALGDALATVINAQGQMNVKAPGVQVQQGAGLGKIAEMFATSPEIASDIKSRQQALLDQYKQMAIGESSAAKRELERQRIQAIEEKNRLYGKQVEKMGAGREEGRQFREERAKVQDERYVKDKMLGLKKDFRKDYRYKDAYKEDLAFDQVNKLMDAAQKGNQIAFNAVGTKMARAMSEVGVLTESDVSRYIEGGSLTRKAGDSLLRMINGKPSDATMDDIKQITNVLKDAHSSRLQPIFEDYVNDAVQTLGKTREQAYKEFGFPLPQDLKNEDAKIESFMKKNNITNKDEAIKILKEYGKL
jgi:hypothetical protein